MGDILVSVKTFASITRLLMIMLQRDMEQVEGRGELRKKLNG